MSDLFSPVEIGGLRLANRIVMAPMSRNRADAGEAAHALTAKYYEQRSGAGLIVTEASPVSPQGRASRAAPGIYDENHIAGWRLVTRAVHAKGGRIFLQLWHAGRISLASLQPGGAQPVAPSAIAAQGFAAPRALAAEEIPAVVAQFANAAKNAKEAGFDGVEVHAANGYLIDSFLRDGSNRRADAYGGPVVNRARFLLEILDAVESVWDRGRIGVRLSPANPYNDIRDSEPQRSFGEIARMLGGRRLAFLHVDESPREGFDWAAFRRRYAGTYIANGGYDRERAAAALESGHADLASFGVLYLANPDLVERFRAGAPLNPPDRSTFYGGGEHGYTDYPVFRGQ
ncbi:MAG TPA: alkene reductase [Burkholderiales bacterium]|nr:alkene reductase [Burkholderiales bacterium]